MLATTTLRTDVPPEEQLDRLPFKMTELGSFKTMRTLPMGTTVLLTDATEEENLDTAPYMLIGLMANGPATPDDRGRFAQQIAAALPGLRDARIRIVGADADRRYRRIRDADRSRHRQGQYAGHGGAMAALWRREHDPADRRRRQARRVAAGVHPLQAVRDGIAPR